MKWIKRQKVGSSMTDAMGHLSVLGIFQIAEEAATEFMGALNLDSITTKKAYNAVWVFTKSKVEIHQNIDWNEEYTVVCFLSEHTHASISIDIGIKNKSDELCAYSRIEMFALDLQSGRLRRLSTVGIADSLETEAPLADLAFTRFDAENLPEVDQVKVQYTNIDLVGHTNNKEYIRWFLNTYSVQELEAKPIRTMEVVYHNQSFEHDILTIRKGSFQGTELLAVQKEDKLIAKCAIVREGAKASQ